MSAFERHEHQAYGLFPGGDPRRFTPDGESCTDDEIAKHKAACAEWDAREAKGDTNEPVAGAIAGPGFIACGVSGFGIGVYSYDCDDPECPEAESAPLDPEDGNAHFAQWWAFDAIVTLNNEDDEESRMRVAFLAGFRAREASQ